MPFDNEDKKKFEEYTNDMNSWINENGTDTFILKHRTSIDYLKYWISK